ncbi:MAG: bifunctional glutamate N-acetyltransferase/amino-acid acetyltransferase ArgJ [Thermodesulfovibrionales bacterium]
MTPEGFLFSTVKASIKEPHRKDLALIYSKVEANIAGTFTTNKIKAAPVRLDMEKIKSGRGQAIVVNSGNANACTGEKGLLDAVEIIKKIADSLKIKPSLIYMCSTGVIGVPLPMEKIRKKIPELIRNIGKSEIEDIAKAMMTTDTFPKIISKGIKIGNKEGKIVGICKGAGMICPDMATMLCFLMTDIAVERDTLDKTLREAVEQSFNRITVDGCQSTNDTVLMMANGVIGNSLLTKKSGSYLSFKEAIDEITYELARLIVKDGEGATKLIEVEVKGARSERDAEKAAFAIANSNLVKTAIYGNDPNWGRIMAAIGHSGIEIKEEKIDIYFGEVKTVGDGVCTGRDKYVEKILKKKEIRLIIDLKLGKSSAKVLTCDLTEDYIRANKAYRT